MSGIPEFRRGGREGPQMPPIRRAAGVIGLVAGVLMMLGYLMLAVTQFGFLGLMIAHAGSVKPEVVMGGSVIAVSGVIAFVIGVYALLVGIRGMKTHPGPTAASLVGFWAVLLMIMYALAMTNMAIAGASMRNLTPYILWIIGSALVMIAAFAVRPGASFGAWVTGSSLGIAGLIVIIISNYLYRATVLGGVKIVNEAGIGDIAILNYTPILIGGIIAAAAVLIAPFLGAARAWISEIIAAVGAIIAAGSLTYISIVNIGITYDMYSTAEYAASDIADILKLIGITGTAGLGLIATASIIGIVALIFAIIHLATTHQQQASTHQPPPPPA